VIHVAMVNVQVKRPLCNRYSSLVFLLLYARDFNLQIFFAYKTKPQEDSEKNHRLADFVVYE
jgi:hypothetical protein